MKMKLGDKRAFRRAQWMAACLAIAGCTVTPVPLERSEREHRDDQQRLTHDLALPALSFGDAPVGNYTRPQLRAVYSASFVNAAARALYPADDPRASQATVHYLGAAAEWWFGRDGGY
jgi:hypothetical protein